jgi:hypothetical protein
LCVEASACARPRLSAPCTVSVVRWVATAAGEFVEICGA